LSTPIPSFITVRSTSSRLPGKCFLPFGEGGVLDHIVTRAIHFGLRPIICTTKDPEDDEIVALAERHGIEFFRGPTINKLLRWSQCCTHFGLEAFHSVDADDPFFCGDEVKRSFAMLETGYDMIAPTPSSSGGGATVGYSLKASVIKQACKGLEENADTEMMWSYVDKVANLRKATLPDPPDSVVSARLTLDYHEDYILLEAVRLLLGNLATRAEVCQLLEANPDLERINAFRTGEWSANQKSKSLQ
jgi:spore coat polysaccharide biosynthesis protein SpsF